MNQVGSTWRKESILMSEQENVAVVQRAYQAILEGDTSAAGQLLTDDVVLVSPGPKDLVPWAGEYHGPGGVLQYYTALSQGVEMTGMKLRELIAQGDKVVALGEHTGRVRATGRSYDLNWVQVFTVREGKIAAWDVYHDTYLVAEAARSG
jgi:ketosteroid isomerase-like protein